jgi:anti-sigma regulatory factor (Ser/Thr protein kinase)
MTFVYPFPNEPNLAAAARTLPRGLGFGHMGKHPPMAADVFRHEATFYEGADGFATAVVPFIAGQIATGAVVLVMADPERTGTIRAALGPETPSLRFEDPDALGRNPGRLIPRWTDFAATADQRPLVGVGALRYSATPAEQVEFELHEALLNVAFANGTGWRLVCPFDIEQNPDAAREARRSHPAILEGERISESPTYLGVGAAALTMSEPLPKPPSGATELAFEQADLPEVRAFLRDHIQGSDPAPMHAADLVLAAHEAATNCLRHGGGWGRVLIWREGSTLLCEVEGNGLITDPLVGRRRPDARRGGGLGLWIVHQVCDLVQIRSGPNGTVVRMHMQLAA